VLIEAQQSVLLGRIIQIRLPERERHQIGPFYSGSDELDAIGEIQLLGSIALDTLRISAGIDLYPRLGDRAYAAPHDFIAAIPLLSERGTDGESSVRLDFGSINSTETGRVKITPEKLFGRHCAILGATGGGKSWTTSRILEECIKNGAKVVLLDATGEYRQFVNSHTQHCHLGAPVTVVENSEKCLLPPSNFEESDFLALFEPAGKVQGPKFRAAIRSLRLAQLAPKLATDGIIKKIGQPKKAIIEAESEATISGKLDDPRQFFSCHHLTRQLEQECVWPEAFGSRAGEKDPTKWGGESGEFAHCLSLVSRINGVLSSPTFSCVFSTESSTSLLECIDNFLSEDARLLRICVSGISYEFKARQIVANAIGRHFLALARAGRFAEQPVLLVVDEAHNFLGRTMGGEDNATRLDAFELIAKEGRKFGINICLVTQRPRDLTEDILSQIGTLIVHRLTNDRDRDLVERACGAIDKSASTFLPTLKQGEAAVIGVDFPIPLTIQMDKPTFRPLSDGPNYQKHWRIEEPR
jgi:hypothetical protein